MIVTIAAAWRCRLCGWQVHEGDSILHNDMRTRPVLGCGSSAIPLRRVGSAHYWQRVLVVEVGGDPYQPGSWRGSRFAPWLS